MLVLPRDPDLRSSLPPTSAPVPTVSFLTCPISAQPRAPDAPSRALSCVTGIICHHPTNPWAPGGWDGTLAGLSQNPAHSQRRPLPAEQKNTRGGGVAGTATLRAPAWSLPSVPRRFTGAMARSMATSPGQTSPSPTSSRSSGGPGRGPPCGAPARRAVGQVRPGAGLPRSPVCLPAPAPRPVEVA